MNKRQPDLSIIVPVYNEEQTIMAVLKRIMTMDSNGLKKEIIMVDDGSTDKTRRLLKKFEGAKNLKIIYKKYNGGKGSAVKVGIKQAKGKTIIIQDADLEYNPDEIPSLVKPILSGETKVVYGSRFLGTIRNMDKLRLFANKLLTFLINVLYGSHLTDSCTCYKAFDAETLKKFNLKSDGFEICHEITANTLRRGYKIKELPISYQARSRAEGVKSSWKDLFVSIGTIAKYRFKNYNYAL